MKSKLKDIDAEESRLLSEKQSLQTLNDELMKNRLEMESELDQLKTAPDLKILTSLETVLTL